MKQMPEPIPNISCRCVGSYWIETPEDCVCPDMERALRGWMSAKSDMPSMTETQRNWALDEIASIEGCRRSDYEDADDAMVARGVLDAWTDYCRDKGLL